MFKLFTRPARSLFDASLEFRELIGANKSNRDVMIDERRINPIDQLRVGIAALMLWKERMRRDDYKYDTGLAKKLVYLPLNIGRLPVCRREADRRSQLPKEARLV